VTAVYLTTHFQQLKLYNWIVYSGTDDNSMLVLWIVKQCGFIGRHPTNASLENNPTAFIFWSADGSIIFFRNPGSPHSITTHKTNIGIFTARRTQNLLQYILYYLCILCNNCSFYEVIFKTKPYYQNLVLLQILSCWYSDVSVAKKSK
jgi:hypothetical protein